MCGNKLKTVEKEKDLGVILSRAVKTLIFLTH